MSDLRGMLKRSVHVWCGRAGCRNEDDMATVRDLHRLGWRKTLRWGWICPDCQLAEQREGAGR